MGSGGVVKCHWQCPESIALGGAAPRVEHHGHTAPGYRIIPAEVGSSAERGEGGGRYRTPGPQVGTGPAESLPEEGTDRSYQY
jgi:hypothetical protein